MSAIASPEQAERFVEKWRDVELFERAAIHEDVVLAAYATTDPEGDWSEDWATVWVDSGAGQPLPPEHPLAAERGGVDQAVLSNLLRSNMVRRRYP